MIENAEIIKIFETQKDKAHVLALTTTAERIEKIERIIEYMRKHKKDFHAAMHADLHRGPVDIDAEWLMVKAEANYAIKHLRKWMEPHRVKNSLMTMGTDSYYQYEPKGVVLIMTPWNAPLAIPLVPLIGAIAAGNAAILKPSELSPHSSGFISQLVQELFAPDEVAIFEGDASVATALLELPFDHVFFTGGPEIGKIVMRAAAEHLSSVTLELGGKNPVIVDQTADLTNTAAKIAWGKCANCGQACVAPDYVLVQEKVHDAFVELLGQELTRMYDPDGRGVQQSAEYARIINNCHFERIKYLLDDAVEKGATVVIGGETDEADNFIAPTVLTDVTSEMLVMQEEIFGPLLAVKRYKSREDAIEEVRQHEKPLSLYVYSTDRGNIDFFLKRTTAGNSVVNHNMIQAGINPHLPFGGVNNSGTGRIVGKATFMAFSNERSIVEQPLGLRDFSTFSFPPYSDLYKRVLGFLAK